MICDPYALTEIDFVDDWDLGRDRIIGKLFVPKALRDARALVNIHVEHSMVHPDLRCHVDPWGEERKRKHEEALKNYPRQFVYPVEVIIPLLTRDGQLYRFKNGALWILYHSLTYEAGEYRPGERDSSFHPPKED